MNNSLKRKSVLTTFVLVSVLAAASVFAAIPTASAYSIDTYAFLSVYPNPVGVNEQVAITAWLNVVPPVPVSIGGPPFKGYMITVTDPSGANQTFGPYDSDPISNAFITYTPTQLGTYHVQFYYPGQTHPNGNVYKPSLSTNVALTVQQQQISLPPENPLPSSYWERPINYENRQWWTISGNWLLASSNNGPGAGRFNPNTKGPNTGHILWKMPLSFGGLVGGEFGDRDFYTGIQYENKFQPPVIISGKLYINLFPQVTAGTTMPGFECIDLRTGNVDWVNDGKGNGQTVNVQLQGFGNTWSTLNPGYPPLAAGELFGYESPNQHGIIPYLWGIGGLGATTRYDLYDAFTGRWILSLNNAMTGTNVIGPNGELLVYIMNGATNWLALWNSTLAIPLPAKNGTDMWQWRPPAGKTIDWRAGVQWNVTIADLAAVPGIQKIAEGKILAQSVLTTVFPYMITRAAYDANTGAQLWMKNLTNPADRPILGAVANGIYTDYIKETLQWYGYSMTTGDLVWGPSQPEEQPWALYASGTGDMTAAAYGKFFTTSYSGFLTAYDIASGNRIWAYSTGNAGLETPYGTYPIWSGTLVADNKVYIGTGEHSPNTPLYKGEQLHCVNIDSGQKIWSIKGWYFSPSIADGYLVAFNYGDNQLYCFGKGKTETTVTATPVAGSSTSVLISGKITDQSPAQPGTAVVPDGYMSQWMEYVHMQQPLPSLVGGTGVPVQLLASKPDGTTINIATINADCEGNFAYEWTPPSSGTYEVTAAFPGTESYWDSYASTAAAISAAPGTTATPAPTQTPAPATSDIMGLPAGAWVIGVIVVILLLVIAALVLRKK